MLLVALAAGSAAAQSVQTLTPSPIPDGITPRYVGYTVGITEDGRALTWLEHSEVNAVRAWLGSGIPKNVGFGQLPSTRDQFVAYRLALKNEIDSGLLGSTSSADCQRPLSSATLSSQYVDWATYLDWRASGRAETFGTFNRLGLHVLMQHSLTRSQFPLTGSPADASSFTPAQVRERWELWRHMFALAYHYAFLWDVASWQSYNEPNHDGGKLPKAEFIERQRLVSDAVHMAVELVNRRRARCGGATLTPELLAPNTSGHTHIVTNSASNGWLSSPIGSPNDRDYYCSPDIQTILNNAGSNECWGAYALLHQYASDFYGIGLTAAQSYATLFHTYAFQPYGGETRWRKSLDDFWRYVSYGQIELGIALTEMNIHTASDFSQTDATLDTPSKYLGLAGLLMNDARANIPWPYNKDLYIFKQRQASGKKNGTHYTSADDSVMGGATNGAEVIRLFAKGFSGANYRYPVTRSGDIDALASYSLAERKGYVMTINKSASARSVTLDLAPWGVANRLVMIESVSALGRGAAAWHWVAGDKLAFYQPAQSVMLIAIPIDANTGFLLEPVADSTIKNGGSNSYKNYGTSAHLYAASHATNENTRNMAFLKFQLPSGFDPNRIQFVELAVWGQSKTVSGHVGQETVAHVYGLVDDAWTETGITWSTAPNVDHSYRDVDDIAENHINGIGESATLLGHMTGQSGETWLGVDVTEFVKQHTGRDLTFVITREVRYEAKANQDIPDEDPVSDDDHRSLWMASGENPDKPHPTLVVIHSP